MLYLKWEDEVVFKIDNNDRIKIEHRPPAAELLLSMYASSTESFLPEEFKKFLQSRLVSPHRRDIGRILHRLGLREFNLFSIAEKTKAINPQDRFWIISDPNERYCEAVASFFKTVLPCSRFSNDDFSLFSSPGGENIKTYGIYRGRFGIYKKRLYPTSSDIEAELAVYMLCEEMGVPCCPVYRIDKDTIFSQYLYDYQSECFAHFSSLLPDPAADDLCKEIISSSEITRFRLDVLPMLIVDFVTRQEDRHANNFAVKYDSGGWIQFYPLYDNGRSLLYSETAEGAKLAGGDVLGCALPFGHIGTTFTSIKKYYTPEEIRNACHLDISSDRGKEILNESGFNSNNELSHARYNGALSQICGALAVLRDLSRLIRDEQQEFSSPSRG